MECPGRGTESALVRYERGGTAPKALVPSARGSESLRFLPPGSDVGRWPPLSVLACAPLFLEVIVVGVDREIEVMVRLEQKTAVRQQRNKIGSATTHYVVQFGLDDFKLRRHRRFWVHQEIRSCDVYSAVPTTWPRSCGFLSIRNALGVWRRAKKQLRRSSENFRKN